MQNTLSQLQSEVGAFDARLAAFLGRVSAEPQLDAGFVAALRGYVASYERIELRQGYAALVARVEAFRARLWPADGEEQTGGQLDDYLDLLETTERARGLAHLWAYCRRERRAFGLELRRRATERGRALLKQMNWPHTCDYVQLASHTALFPQLCDAVHQLLRLQIVLVDDDSSSDTDDETDARRPLDRLSQLWAVQLFLEPIGRRFLYHFSGDRVTNRLDKPEWMFASAAKSLDACRGVFNGGNALFSTLAELGLGFVDPWRCFVAGFASSVVGAKIAREQASLRSDDALFRKWLDETLAFDRRLADAYQCGDVHASSAFERSPALLETWLEIEVHSANTLCRQLLNSPTAWQPLPDDDSGVVNACRSMVDLVDAVTQRYSCLDEQDNKLAFLEAAQLPAIQRLYSELAARCKAALAALSASFAHAALAPLADLCRLANSADYFHSHVRQLLYASPVFDVPPISLGFELRRYVDLLASARQTVVSLLLDRFAEPVLFRSWLATLHTKLVASQLHLLFAELSAAQTTSDQHTILRSFLC